MNSAWDKEEKNIRRRLHEMEDAISLAREIFTEESYFKKYNANKKEYTRQFNKAVYDLLTYYLSQSNLYRLLENDPKRQAQFKGIFEEFFEHPEINREFQVHTTDLKKVVRRFVIIGDLIKKHFDKLEIIIPFPGKELG